MKSNVIKKRFSLGVLLLALAGGPRPSTMRST